jgi:hypothetical protein
VTQLKPPQQTDNEKKKPKPQLSILTDIEKSAKADMEWLGKIVSAQPQSGVLGIADFNKSARIISDIITSPAFQRANEVLVETQKLSSALVEPIARITEVGRVIIEPMQRIQESVVALNNQYRFDVSLKALSFLDSPALADPEASWARQVYSPTPYSPPKSLAVVIRENMEVLATDLISQIDRKFEEQFDKFIEKGKIPAGIKNASCYCSKCGRLLFKVADISHFMTGTIKCNCGETLQIPRDLKIESPKS